MPRKPRPVQAPVGSCDVDLLTGPALRILRRHKAPPGWLEPLAVHWLVAAAWHGLPGPRGDDKPPAHAPARTVKAEQIRGLVRRYRAQERHGAAVIAQLSAEDPPKFFALLADLSAHIHQRLQSPEFVTALRLWLTAAVNPKTIDRPREDLAAAIARIEGLPVTSKTVEHALGKARTAGLLRS